MYKLLFVLLFCSLSVFGQEPPYNQMRSNYEFRGVRIDSLFLVPKYTDTSLAPTSIVGSIIRVAEKIYVRYNNKWNQSGSLIDTSSLSARIDSKADTSLLNGVIYFSDTTTLIATKSDLSPPIDTTSLSARIELRVKYTDTAAMLLPYLRKVDTSSLSNRINLKLNLADTSAMLSVYLRKADTSSLSNRINLKVNISDTGSMLSPYLRKTDTSSLSNRINLKLNISDTAAMLAPYLTGGDTISLSNRINTKLSASDTLSLSSRINGKIDSLYRTSTNVYFVKNGVSTLAYTDSVGGGGGQNGRWGNDTAVIILAKVRNSTGTTMTRGTVVMLSGATGDVASVIRANNKYDSTSARTIGLVKDPISAGDTGWVVTQGQASKLQLGAYTAGDILWLDSIDGGLTKTKPYAPYHEVFVGIVERANNGNGLAYVKPQNGQEFGELHDVQIINPVNNQIIVYSDTQDIWKNRNVYSVVDTTNVVQTKYKSDTSKTNIYNSISSIDLQKVTDVGNTTTNDVKVNQLYLYDPVVGDYGNVSLGDNAFLFKDAYNNSSFYVQDGNLGLNNSSNNVGTISSYNLTTGRNFFLPDTSGTFALRGDSTLFQTKYRSDTARTNTYTALASKLNISDTSSMLSPYLRSNTASATYLAKSDSTIYQTKYRSDTGRTNTYSALNTKLNISDTANKWVNSIYRKSGQDSIFYKIGSTEYAIKDSIGGGGGADSTIFYTKYRSDSSRTNIYSAINGKFTLPSLTSGSVLFSDGTTISQDNSNLYWDNTNNRLGIQQSTPTSSLHLNFNQNSVSQADDNGILLANSTAAIAGTQSISPPIVWQGNGWKTTATAASQDVRFRADVLPVQNTTNAGAVWRLSANINNGGYTERMGVYTSGATSTFTYLDVQSSNQGQVRSGNIYANSFINAVDQIQAGGAMASSSNSYRLTNAGGVVVPKIAAWAANSSGTKYYGIDNTNGITLSAANVATNLIARAGIDITNLTNTTGSESGDLAFFTQSGGTAMSEKMRIFSSGNTAIGTTTDAGFKLDVNGTARISSTITANRVTIPNSGSNSLTVGTSSNTYRLTNAGSDDNASTFIAEATSLTAGNLGYSFGASTSPQKGLLFLASNGTRHIARAGIQITNLTNTAGSESGDLAFLTQSSGTAMSEKMRIFSNGNTAIGTTTDAGYKLDISGTSRISGNATFSADIIRGSQHTLGGNNYSTSTQVVVGFVNTNVQQYRITNGGASITPKGLFTESTIISGANGFIIDPTNSNGISLTASNGTRHISRAGINIANLVNTAGSEAGDLIFLTQSGGTAMSEKLRITSGGGITLTATNTAAGTTGNQTINKPSGTVNIAAGGTTITVTNNLVTTSSIVFAVIRTNDTTADIKNVVPSSGSFTINLNAATTAETSIGFFVIN